MPVGLWWQLLQTSLQLDASSVGKTSTASVVLPGLQQSCASQPRCWQATWHSPWVMRLGASSLLGRSSGCTGCRQFRISRPSHPLLSAQHWPTWQLSVQFVRWFRLSSVADFSSGGCRGPREQLMSCCSSLKSRLCLKPSAIKVLRCRPSGSALFKVNLMHLGAIAIPASRGACFFSRYCVDTASNDSTTGFLYACLMRAMHTCFL